MRLEFKNQRGNRYSFILFDYLLTPSAKRYQPDDYGSDLPHSKLWGILGPPPSYGRGRFPPPSLLWGIQRILL